MLLFLSGSVIEFLISWFWFTGGSLFLEVKRSVSVLAKTSVNRIFGFG